MKATLSIDDDLLTQAERIAKARSVSLDEVVSDLIRQSLNRQITFRSDNGFPVFPRTPGTPMITDEDLRRADEDY